MASTQQPQGPVPASASGLASGQAIPAVLHSANPAYELPRAPYLLPPTFTRYELSTLLNTVLALPAPVPFDIAIDGYRLPPRETLQAWLARHGRSTEETLQIEHLVTAAYDGVVRILDHAHTEQHALAGHTGAVVDVAWVGKGPTPSMLATASLDRTARLWSVVEDSTVVPHAILALHTDALESVSASPNAEHVLTAAADGLLGLFSLDRPAAHQTDPEPVLTDGKRKKRRMPANGAEGHVFRKAAERSYVAHTGRIASAGFLPGHAQTLYSAGWDRTIKTWDAETGANEQTRTATSSIRCVESIPQNGSLLLTAQTDRHLNVWDLRSQAQNVAQSTLAVRDSHMVALRSHPTSEQHFAAVSLKGDLSIWDLRSFKTALMDVPPAPEQTKDGKLICLDWNGELLMAGGEDKKAFVWQASVGGK